MNMYVHKHGFYEHAFQLSILHCNGKELKVMPKLRKIVDLGHCKIVLEQINSSECISHCFRRNLILQLA